MGAPKALLPWGSATLLEHAIRQAQAAHVHHLVVVVGPAIADLPLEGVQRVLNPAPASGRSASIRLAAQALPDDIGSVLIQSVDQPCSASVIESLFEAVEGGAEVALPSLAGRRGHPVCLAGRLLGELRTIQEADQGLRAVVHRHAVIEVPVTDPAVSWNLNDPEAYAQARAASAKRTRRRAR
jgi:molybdenum cofactor cytidylyltransferase